ncbi:hypothetical protein FG386_001877 [Cryptosporidium ryanae]|uniref:uncharacterized protein n=1 Tax=Cryptosporidium ryanae TaxID=515981 RepID=UPI00351A1D55|nr:hypothetical protein FG386_001877 [Cryptosporidium ryanae]
MSNVNSDNRITIGCKENAEKEIENKETHYSKNYETKEEGEICNYSGNNNIKEFNNRNENCSDISGDMSNLEDYGEEEESDDNEGEEEIRKILPERSSRGKRYVKLVGDEEEKDAMFWGHDTWEEEENDSGWSSEDEKIELEILGDEYSDNTDNSYMNDDSDDGKEEEEKEMAMAEAEDAEYEIIDKKISNSKNRNKYLSKGKYKDPSLFLKSAQKDILKKVRNKLKNKKNKVDEKMKKKTHKIIEPRTISVRASTLKKKQNLEEVIRKREEKKINVQKKRQLIDEDNIEINGIDNDINSSKFHINDIKKQKKNTKNHLTQEDRLKLCKEIEKLNIESLSQLEAIEEHKRYLDNTSSSIRKQFKSGPLSIYISWSSYLLMDFEKDKSDEILKNEEYCREIIIYTDGNIPKTLYQSKSKQNDDNDKLCCIFGTPAKYLDPLTNRYYCNIEAFKAIRKDYYANSYKKFIYEMNDIQELIKCNKAEIIPSEYTS